MGLRENTRNINDTLQRQLTEKEAEKLHKKKEKLKKENLQRYKKDLEKFTKSEFRYYFKIASSQYKYNFLSAERKEKILNNFFTIIETTDINGFKTVPFMIELKDYYYNNYKKWLEFEYKSKLDDEAYTLITEAEEIKEKKLKEIEEKQKAEKEIKIYNTILKTLLILLLSPILILLAFIKVFTK